MHRAAGELARGVPRVDRQHGRIAIVGAGPAGLSMAKCLADAGCRDVTLFEKSAEVGGKSCTIEWGGHPCDLGTCYTAFGYGRVHDWLAEYGLSTVPCRVVYVGGRHCTRYPLHGISKREALWQAIRYSYHSRRFRSGRMQPAEYGMLALDWLRARRLPALERVMHLAITGMGYGYLDEVAIYHAFHFLDPALVLASVNGWVYEVPEGWQTLWRRMSREFDVRLETPPLAIERDATRVTVRTASGDFDFDQLVITIPLDDAARVMPLTEREQHIERSISWRWYVTTLAVCDGWFLDGDEGARFYAERVDSHSAATVGHLMGAKRVGVPRHGRWEDIDPAGPAYVCYQRAGDYTDAELIEFLRRDLRADGASLRDVVVQKRWRYMPALDPAALRSGIVNDMRDVQGQQRTWYSGASFSHENVRDIAVLNARLAPRIAAAVKMDATHG